MTPRTSSAPALILGCWLLTLQSARGHDDPMFFATHRPTFVGPVVRTPGVPASIEYPAVDMSLLSWVTLPELGDSAGSDCWGYTSPSGREYAIFCLVNGTAFVEVTDPGAPVVIATHPGSASSWRDAKTYEDHAYVVTEGDGTIQVFDLSQIDGGVVTLVSTVTTGPDNTHNVAIDEASGYLYRCGAGNGLHIFDLANKSMPTYVGAWSGSYVHDAQVVTYTSGPYAGKQVAFCLMPIPGLVILDVTDKSGVVQLSSTTYTQKSYPHQGWLSPDRNHFYVNDELDEQSFGLTTNARVFDVSNLSAPFLAATFTNGVSSTDHNMYTKDNYVYAANYRSGLRVFDVTNPLAAAEVAFFDTVPQGDGLGFDGLWSCYPYYASGTIVTSDRDKGMFVVRHGPPELAFSFPNGLSPLFDPAGELLQVQVTEAVPGLLDPSSVKLHIDAGAGYSEVSLSPAGPGLYDASLPAHPCGSSVLLYFSARTVAGTTWTDPPAGEAIVYKLTAAPSETVLMSADMETDPGWTAGLPTDDATTGTWVRAIPNGTAAAPDIDTTGGSGRHCFETGHQAIGDSVGANDVDSGKTTLVTAPIDLSAGTATISYWRWYSNSTGAAPGSDVFQVDVSNDNGQTWTNVETVGPTGPETQGSWFHHEFDVSQFVAPSGQVKVRFVAADYDPASVVEAAIDDFRVVRYGCGQVCQADLGFGGPGSMQLSVCGPGLANGQSSPLQLTGALPNTTAALFVGLQSTPTPLLGGTLVPVPVALSVFVPTNASGELILGVPGGGGPFSVYVQAVQSNPAQPLGVDISNAVRIDVAP